MLFTQMLLRGDTAQAEGGGHTSCFCQSRQLCTKAREEVGSPDPVWPPPHPNV